MNACEKDEVFQNKTDNYRLGLGQQLEDNSLKIFNSSKRFAGKTKPVKTVLGNKKENPYKVENMRKAYQNLYKNGKRNIATSDLYIKFKPRDAEDMKKLIESDIYFTDFPLDHEIIQEGDYYSEEDFPSLYSTVKIDTRLPNIPYEVLNELYIDDSNPFILAESMRLTGNEDAIKKIVGPEFTNIIKTQQQSASRIITEEPIPDCPSGCFVVVAEYDDSSIPPTPVYECDCDSGGGSGPQLVKND